MPQIKIYIRLLIFVCLQALMACDKDIESKSWRTFNDAIQKEIDNHSKEQGASGLEDIFHSNKTFFYQAVEFCENYPSVKKVGADDSLSSFYDEQNAATEMQAAIENTRLSMSTLSVLSINCGRRADVEGNPLSVVWLVMHASGLSVSGATVGILYDTEWSRSSNPMTDDQIKSRGYRGLGEEGWYIFKN